MISHSVQGTGIAIEKTASLPCHVSQYVRHMSDLGGRRLLYHISLFVGFVFLYEVQAYVDKG